MCVLWIYQIVQFLPFSLVIGPHYTFKLMLAGRDRTCAIMMSLWFAFKFLDCLQISSLFLIRFDGLKQGLEVSGAKTLRKKMCFSQKKRI